MMPPLPPFSGTTRECLQNFFWRHKWEDSQSFMAEHLHVDKGTVRHWKNGRMPSGDPLLRMRVLLDLDGYTVEEYTILPKPVQQFAQIIALGMITVREAADLLGYKNIQDVYGVVLRGQGLMPHRQFRLERYVENSIEELEQEVAKLHSELERLPLESLSQSAEEQTLETRVSSLDDAVQESFVQGAVPLDPFADRLVQSLQGALFEIYLLWRCLSEREDAEELLKQLQKSFNKDEWGLIVLACKMLLLKQEPQVNE